MIRESSEVRLRCEAAAEYLIENRTTIRATAAKFGISKSTVHKDITERLEKIDPVLYQTVKEVLECNKAVRHIRGGEATKLKYLSAKFEKKR